MAVVEDTRNGVAIRTTTKTRLSPDPFEILRLAMASSMRLVGLLGPMRQQESTCWLTNRPVGHGASLLISIRKITRFGK